MMPKRTPYALALEVDRSLNLSLSNGQFEVLAKYIETSECRISAMRKLVCMLPREVYSLIESFRKNL